MKHQPSSRDLGAWFQGPKAENATLQEEMILYILRDYFHWRRNYFPGDKMLISRSMQRDYETHNDALVEQVDEMLASLRRHFPFYSPRYIGHMISDQTIPSILGYFAGMLYNSNNVSPEAAPVTVEWELEVGADMLRMLGYTPPPSQDTAPEDIPSDFGWAHITGGGTVANIEALWVARNIRYFPMAVQAVMRQQNIPLEIQVPGKDESFAIADLDDWQLMNIKPDDAIALLPRFVDAIRKKFDLPLPDASKRAWELLDESGLNLAYSGVSACFDRIQPVIFVAGTAHYSIAKAVNILGIGQEHVVQVAVDSNFRMDINDLEAKILSNIDAGRLPLAVVTITGSTEEGSVDPVHKVVALRKRLEEEHGVSFWLHVDAAWGGYIRTLFVDEDSGKNTVPETLRDVAHFVSTRLTAIDGKHVEWGNSDVGRAFMAIASSESVTIDPHKMGYIPYPAGVVAFRDDRIRHFLVQEAPYITAGSEEREDTFVHRPPVNVGPFILEGSKPGAAAASIWLSHRVISPDRAGYGQIMRASLLSARELYEYLHHWNELREQKGIEADYEFIPVTAEAPDTNIVCFVIKQKHNNSLLDMNALTRRVYKRFTIEAELGEREYSYSQPYFLSRTRFTTSHYSVDALRPFFERAGILSDSYNEEGVFVLRSTVMNPYIQFARETDSQQDYIGEFMEELAHQTVIALGQMGG